MPRHQKNLSGGSSIAPSSSVVFETSYDISPDVGASTNYAREDHTHGTPAAVDISGLIPKTQNALLKDPTGFTFPADVIVTYDSSARTITLTGTVAAYWQGEVVADLTTGWASEAHDDTSGAWFLSYNGSAFVWSQDPWTFDQLQIAYVFYDGDKFALRECHGLMEWSAHEEFHRTVGTYMTAGGDLSSYVPSSTTAGNRRPAVSATTIRDEDIPTVIPTLTSDQFTQLTLTGSGTADFTVDQAEIVPVSGSQPYYNSFSGTWVQSLMSNNSYMTVWLIAMPVTADAGSQKYRYSWLQGQSNGSLASQQALTPSNLSVGTLSTFSPEFVFIDKVIIKYLGGNWTIEQVDKITGTRGSQTVLSVAGLTSVTTDATLTGDGTAGSPLSALTALNLKQDTLVSGTNIKTVNDTSLLGSGNITISGSGLSQAQVMARLSIGF